MNYTPHEIRTIIRNCNTLPELQQFEFLLAIESIHYTLLQMMAFKAGVLNQKFKITKKYQA